MLNEHSSREGRCFKASRHASIRAQQRVIPRIIQDGLLDYGDLRDAGSGASSYSFSKRSWRKFGTYLGTQARHYERYRHVYLVAAADGTVITVGWRH